MSKELTPLETFYELLSPIDLTIEELKKYYLIETALKRLEKIDNKKVNKELKVLKSKLKEVIETMKKDDDLYLVYGKINGKEDLVYRRFSELSGDNRLREQVKKQDEILKIIKEKRVDIGLLTSTSLVETYNHDIKLISYKVWQQPTELAQQEFDLLKEYFK